MTKLLFDLPEVNSKEDILKLAEKVNSKSSNTNKTPNVMMTLSHLRKKINESLGKYKELYEIVSNKQQLEDYINKCIKNGILAIDTETTGLNPISDDLVGLSIKTTNEKAIYIPYGHISIYTKQRTPNQINHNDLVEQLQRVVGLPTIWHNAIFDIRVLLNSLGVYFTNILWDTQIASHILNENEPHGLKQLHTKYCLLGEEDEVFTYSYLFDSKKFSEIPIDVGYIYAARDAEMTFELYEYQSKFLKKEYIGTNHKYSGISNAYFTIELPVLLEVVKMEQKGVCIDEEYANELHNKYMGLLEEAKLNFIDTLKPYEKQIIRYNTRNYGKLGNPINYASPQQLAILLYDIIGIKQIGKKERGTGEEVLSKLDLPVAKAILECRKFEKLLGTYIDKLPKVVNEKTGRLHCEFNPSGADTGRFSSSNPNLQNIPSKNKEIRKMFVASEGHVFLGSDFSQQEPRILAFLSDDEGLINAYKQNKDLYAWAASLVYNVPYEECKERYPDGTLNPQGKERRSSMKAIILGIMYSKGAKSISEDLNISRKEAQNVYDIFFKTFPKVKKFIDDSQNFAKQYGYVETIWGRKRRLPDLLLDKYEFKVADDYVGEFNPLEFEDNEDVEWVVDEQAKRYYTNLLDHTWGYEDKQQIIKNARKDGIIIIDNTMKIADAERQCVNSRIQGSAAQQIKLAMIQLGKNEEFKKLGGQVILQVHDELIAEVPFENRVRCGEIMSETMANCAKDIITTVPFKCDVEITRMWFGEEVDEE